jgi:hypothetical protein
MPHTTHANATLTPAGRLALARCVVHDQWPLRRAAERFQVSHTTARRWASRYREHGPAGMHGPPQPPGPLPPAHSPCDRGRGTIRPEPGGANGSCDHGPRARPTAPVRCPAPERRPGAPVPGAPRL